MIRPRQPTGAIFIRKLSRVAPLNRFTHVVYDRLPDEGVGQCSRRSWSVACRYARIHVRTLCILRQPAGPDGGVRGRRSVRRPARTGLQRCPDCRGASHLRAPRQGHGRDSAPAGSTGLGAGSVLGQGRLDRLADDQRSTRDGGREAGVPASLQRSPMPVAGGRLLRVVCRRVAERLLHSAAAAASPGSSRSSSIGPTAACW